MLYDSYICRHKCLTHFNRRSFESGVCSRRNMSENVRHTFVEFRKLLLKPDFNSLSYRGFVDGQKKAYVGGSLQSQKVIVK
jgi:hypothetical protein